MTRPIPAAEFAATEFDIDNCWKRIGIEGDKSCPELARFSHCRNCPTFSLAAAALLDRELPGEAAAGVTGMFGEEAAAQETETESVMVFRVGSEWFALPTLALDEIVELRPIHSLPHRRNSGLLGLGIIDEPSTALLYNSSAVIITLTHAWAAFAILPIYVSLEKVDRTLIEAATDLGDGPIRSFLRVTLPLSLPGVTAALLIVMIPTVGDYVTPRLVGGSDGVMIANAIQAQFGRAMNKPLGAALSVTTMIAVCAMAGATVLALRTAVRAFR